MRNIVRNNRAKNSILNHLNKTESIETESVSNMSKILKLDINLVFVASDELYKQEYTTERSTTTRDRDGKMVTITRKGKLFINDGGYPSSGIKIITKAIIDNKATIISIIALVVSILTYLTK